MKKKTFLTIGLALIMFIYFTIRSLTMKKIGRNDPCPCGSGKKYKHCCGATNAQVETSEQLNTELYQVHQNLTSFVRDKSLSKLEEQYARFGQKYDIDGEARKIHLTGLIPWITTTAYVDEKEQTLFDRFMQINQRRMRPRVRSLVEEWQTITPAIYEVISTDASDENYVMIQQLNSDNTYPILYKDNNDIDVGNILIGILVPFADHYEFMISMVKLVDVDLEAYKALIQQHSEDNEAFPALLAAILTQKSEGETSTSNEAAENAAGKTETLDVADDSVEGILMQQLAEEGLAKETIEASVAKWKAFYDKEQPTIMKLEPYAAAMEYYTRKDMLEDESATQSQIAKRYGTSSSSLSKNYRRIVEAL